MRPEVRKWETYVNIFSSLTSFCRGKKDCWIEPVSETETSHNERQNTVSMALLNSSD